MNEPTKSEKRLISSARKYLEPVKTVDEQIKSIAKEIEQLRCNITSISAIDYSKDRVSGGGVTCGLESSVARFIDTEKEQRRRIDELSEYKCDVINTINSLSEEIGGTMLRYEYLLGMSAKQAHSVFENQFNERQAMRYKEKALIEIGRLKCQ